MIELLIAIVILGGASIAVLTALGTAAAGASTQRQIAGAQTTLGSAGDLIADSDAAYLDCASNTQDEIIAAYQDVVDSATAGTDGVRVADVRFWDGDSFGRTCHFGAGHRLQRLIVRDDQTGSELAVVKRPGDAPTVDLGDLPEVGGYGVGGVVVEITPGLSGP